MAIYDITEIQENIPDATLTNLIPEAAAKTENGWSTGTFVSDQVLYGNTSLKLAGTSSTTEVITLLNTTNINQIPGHSYYARTYEYHLTSTLDNKATWQAYWPQAEPYLALDTFGTANQWNMLSSVNIRSNASWEGPQQFRLDFDNSNIVGIAYYNGIMLIDLTEAYGEGNEPSKEWCDTNIPFFVNTIFIPGTQNKTYFRKGDIINCPYTGNIQSLKLPKGTYKLEVWGAQGGNAYVGSTISGTYHGGYGGYSVGTYTTNDEMTFYLIAGGAGISSSTNWDVGYGGGYNGGGRSGRRYGGSGGGASHIALKTGLLADLVNNQDDILIVAGGGGGAEGYSSDTATCLKIGGAGGGTAGEVGSSYSASYAAGAGTQSGGGVGGSGYTYTGATGSFGLGGDASVNYTYNYSGGGGGGFYGGGGGGGTSSSSTTYIRRNSSGGGGSGYVNPILNNAYTSLGTTSFLSPEGNEEIGHLNNGYCRITILEIKQLMIYVKKENNIQLTNYGTEDYIYDMMLSEPIEYLDDNIIKLTENNMCSISFYNNIYNHIIYFSTLIKGTFANNLMNGISITDNGQTKVNTFNILDSNNDFTFQSFYYNTQPLQEHGTTFIIFSTFNSIAPVFLKNLQIIDLTEEFGAGNEPTKEEMDKYLNPDSIYQTTKIVNATKVLVKTENSLWEEEKDLKIKKRFKKIIKEIDPDTNLLILNDSNNNIYDFMNNDIINYGVYPSSIQHKIGDNSLYFNGSSRLTINNNHLLSSTGDFTIDWWEYITEEVRNAPILHYRIENNNPGYGILFSYQADGALHNYISTSGSDWNQMDGDINGTIMLNQWVHRAIIKNNGNIKFYQNGIYYGQQVNANLSPLPTNIENLHIGWYDDASVNGFYFKGYIDHFRITNKVLWTEDFTPPTEESDYIINQTEQLVTKWIPE